MDNPVDKGVWPLVCDLVDLGVVELVAKLKDYFDVVEKYQVVEEVHLEAEQRKVLV